MPDSSREERGWEILRTGFLNKIRSSGGRRVNLESERLYKVEQTRTSDLFILNVCDEKGHKKRFIKNKKHLKKTQK